jgi:hypothetical protein
LAISAILSELPSRAVTTVFAVLPWRAFKIFLSKKFSFYLDLNENGFTWRSWSSVLSILSVLAVFTILTILAIFTWLSYKK